MTQLLVLPALQLLEPRFQEGGTYNTMFGDSRHKIEDDKADGIPEDIMESARDVMQRVSAVIEAWPEEATVIIARAIKAERDR